MRKDVLEAAKRLQSYDDKELSIAHSGGYGARKRLEVLHDTALVVSYVATAGRLMFGDGPWPPPPKGAA